MSNRDSLGVGDLLPQDVVEVFALEKHSKRGRKKRSRSLRRAFSWLKGKKRRSLSTNGQGLGLGPALDLALDGHIIGYQGHKSGHKSGKQAHPHGNSHAVPKRDDEGKTPAPPLFQENVFMESSRPKYLEDLHTEALKGLKMMLQEETSNGVEYKDNESTISAMTVQTDGGFMTDSTLPDSVSVVSVQSSASVRSSRSGLTRQGSTFRPLKSEKSKTKRRHRKTAVGIPKHVQKELGLDRRGWTQTLDEEQSHNSEAEICSMTDGSQHAGESAKKMNTSLQATNTIQPLSKDKVEQLSATHAGHRDDLALLHHLGPGLEDGPRPRSVAVPWMTTDSSLQKHPPSTVMSMSPQAAYMSKIIPNAVLPPSIDVVEISRGRSRNSVRTVSKSSLQLSSPTPSRASSRASSTRTTSSNITSVSRYIVPIMSDSSCWSTSASSETLVSDSSTISSSSTPKPMRSQNPDSSATNDKVISSPCTSNGTSKSKTIIKEDKVKKDGQFVRSLSVMKSKRAPPPPSRSYSLHGKLKRRPQDLAEVRGIWESSPYDVPALSEKNGKNPLGSSPLASESADSPGYHADTSSLDDSAGSVSLSLIKSQLQEPKTEDVKNNAGTSHEKKDPLQNNKIGSPSSGYSSQDGVCPQIPKQPHSSSPKQKKGIFNIFQKLLPSSPPRPESSKTTKITEESNIVSANPSVRTLRELFNIPPPPKVHAPPAPPPEVWAHNKRTFLLLFGPPAPDYTYAIIKKNPKDRRQQRQSPVSTEGSVKMERKSRSPTETVAPVNGEIHKENNERLAQNGELKVNGKDEKVRVSDMSNRMLVKADEKCEETMVAVKRKGQKASAQAAEVETNTDSLDSVLLARISPLPPLQQLTTTQSTKAASVVSPESSWPPPPPPMAQGNRPDELDLPLPPPPLFGEVGLVLPSTAVSGKPVVKTGTFNVITGPEPKKLHTSNEVVSSFGVMNIPPPPQYSAPPPPTTAVLLPTTENASPPPSLVRPEKSIVPVVKDATPQVSVAKEDPPPLVAEVSSLPPVKLTPPSQEASQSPEDAAPESKFMAPQSIPPPPPLPLQLRPSEQIDRTPLESETNMDSSSSILTPPQSIPPPPPIEPLQLTIHTIHKTADNPETETPPLPPSEFRNSPSPKESAPPSPITIPLPPPLPVQGLVSTKPTSSPLSRETQCQEQTSAAVEPAPVVTPLLLQMVKLRSVNSSPEHPEVQEETPAPEEHKEPPPSTVTSLSPQTVKLRSVNSSPEHPKVQRETPAPEKHEPTSTVTSLSPQTVKLRSVNSSPEHPKVQRETPAPEKHEPTSTVISLSPQTVKLQSVNSSPEHPEVQEETPAPEEHKEPSSTVTSLSPQTVKLRSVNSSPEHPEVQEETPAPEKHEPTSTVTSLSPQTVKLRSVDNTPEPPEAQEPPEPEATVNQQQQSSIGPSSSSNGEVPEKPIRKSLIVTSPTSTSPPVIVTSQPTLLKSEAVVVPPEPSSTTLSSVLKSPPATTTHPSMNLQEAIRLRTAARSMGSPASRFGVPSSLQDFHKSPTSTASFIFSKSNKKVLTGTKQEEDKENIQKKTEVSSVTKTLREAESKNKGFKVPPPVARKPKGNCKEVETSEGLEQTGQKAEQESVKDATEETNGTAGTVGEETLST